MRSIFTDKAAQPTQNDIETALGDTVGLWQKLIDHTKKQYPQAIEEWNFPSEKFGWSFRLKDKKRVLVYLLPRDKFFKVAFVFGEKATDKILESDIAENIKNEIKTSKKFAEGRGIRIEVRDGSIVPDIETLIKVKVNQ